MNARFTVITASHPRVLSKTAGRAPDGAVTRTGGGVLVEGHAAVRGVSTLDELALLLQRLGPDQALTFGIPRRGDGPILSRAKFAERGRPRGAATRTRDQFSWPEGPGILMLDHDPEGETIPRERLVAMIRTAAPGLAGAAMLWWPSASSHICDSATAKDLTGLRGQRLYLTVEDARDIPRAGAALVDRLWAAGQGRIVASVAGAALERCPVDTSVWQPERLDFAAGAVCRDGLEQRRGAPVVIPGTIAVVDTRAALPDDPAIGAAATAARRRARAAAAPKLAATRERYLDHRVEEILTPEAREDADAREQARAVVRRAIDNGVLGADFLVEVEMAPGRFETVTVARILNDREGFHGRQTRDPLEPSYDGGRTTGKLYLLDARPTLFSFAHHGRSFRLSRSPERVELVPGRLADATEKALSVLGTDPAIFDFGGQVVLVESGDMLPLDEHALAHHIGGVVQFWRWRRALDRSEAIDIDPPARLVRQILSLGQRRQLKPLSAIITAPTLRPDGSVLATPGYDEATALLLDPATDVVPSIPAAPTEAESREALDRLMQPFRSFPLVDAGAQGAFLAALLTAAVRPSLPTAPAFAIDAPVQGSGKTLLASCIAALATGSMPEVWPHTASRDDEEVRKRLFTALRSGATALIWDNVTGILDSAALAAAITAPVLRDRVLGRSESLSIPNRAILLLTGNNFCPAGDLPRRVITVRIDPGMDAPFARQFDLDPLEYVLDHRLELVRAALVLIRARLSSTAERSPGRMASFELWDDLVRQSVCWIGTYLAPGDYGDPLDLVRRAQSSDPEQESLFALLEALMELFPKMWFTARDVSQRAVTGRNSGFATEREKALAEALGDITGEQKLTSTKSIGRILRFRQDRIVHGLRLISRQATRILEFRVERTDWGFNRFDRFNSRGFEPLQSDEVPGAFSEGPDSKRLNRSNRDQADAPEVEGR